MLDTFARQIFRQWLAASLLRPRWFRVGQFRRDDGRCLGIITFGRRLLSFIEDALFTLLAPRREAMQALKPQLLLEVGDALGECFVLGLQRRDLGGMGSEQCLQLPDLGRSIHPMLESGPTALVQNNPARPFEGSAHALILPRGVTLHRLDIDAVEQPMKLFGR